MKFRIDFSPKHVPLLKKIITDLKKLSQHHSSDLFCTITDDQMTFHNYYNFESNVGLLYFLRVLVDDDLGKHVIESKKPGNQIVIKFCEEITKFCSAVSDIPDSKSPLFFLGREEDKRYLRFRHEIESGISSRESKTEIDILTELQSSLPSFDDRKIEVFLPLKSLIPFLDEGHSLESPVVLKIYGLEENTAKVTLKIKSNGYKVDFYNLMITYKHQDLREDFEYIHTLSPGILKQLGNACSLSESGFLTLFEENSVLGIIIQHIDKLENGVGIRAQEFLIIPELAVHSE